jgi:hypothetical protein
MFNHTCNRCGYSWKSTHPAPLTCASAKCATRLWNEPRKYGVNKTAKRDGSWNKGLRTSKKTKAAIA